jgi:hypothetical protein
VSLASLGEKHTSLAMRTTRLLSPILACLCLVAVTSGNVVSLLRQCAQGPATWIAGLNVTSRVECAGECSDRTPCTQLQYDEMSGQCDLYSKADTSLCDAQEEEENARSHFYSQVFAGKSIVYIV